MTDKQLQQCLICQKCDNCLMNDVVQKGGKYQVSCQDCQHLNVFDELIISVDKQSNEPPEWVQNYLEDDTVIDGIIIWNERSYDLKKKEYVKK